MKYTFLNFYVSGYAVIIATFAILLENVVQVTCPLIPIIRYIRVWLMKPEATRRVVGEPFALL